MNSTHQVTPTGFTHESQRTSHAGEPARQGAGANGRDGVDTARADGSHFREDAMNTVQFARDTLQSARASAADGAASVRAQVAHNPVASVSIAAAAGLLAGVLMMKLWR